MVTYEELLQRQNEAKVFIENTVKPYVLIMEKLTC